MALEWIFERRSEQRRIALAGPFMASVDGDGESWGFSVGVGQQTLVACFNIASRAEAERDAERWIKKQATEALAALKTRGGRGSRG